MVFYLPLSLLENKDLVGIAGGPLARTRVKAVGKSLRQEVLRFAGFCINKNNLNHTPLAVKSFLSNF